MSYIVRTWVCLNEDCGLVFDHGDPNPHCPTCMCVKVRWQPAGGHGLSDATKHADRTLRSVAGSFGLSDLKSARAGESSHPGLPQGKPLEGMRYGAYGGIPLATTCTAGFAPNPPNIKIAGPTDGAKRFKKQGRIPTAIKAVDPRRITL